MTNTVKAIAPSSMMMMTKNDHTINTTKRYVTLLEILIVLSVLAIVSSIVSVNIYDAIEEERFYQDAQKLVNRFRLAQDFMLYPDNSKTLGKVDARIVLSKHQEHISSHLKITGTNLNENEIAKYDDSKIVLKYIGGFEFIHPNGKHEDEKLELIFASPGGVMTKGILRLYPHGKDDKEDSLYLSFQGQQQTFSLKQDISNPQYHEDDSTKIFPKELYEN